jgi:lipoprotein signal peptidase
MNRNSLPWVVLSLAVMVADRLTKSLVERLTVNGWRRSVIPGFFDLVHTRNPGIAFGLLADTRLPWMRVALIVLSVVAAAAMAWRRPTIWPRSMASGTSPCSRRRFRAPPGSSASARRRRSPS